MDPVRSWQQLGIEKKHGLCRIHSAKIHAPNTFRSIVAETGGRHYYSYISSDTHPGHLGKMSPWRFGNARRGRHRDPYCTVTGSARLEIMSNMCLLPYEFYLIL